jgi:hypothetical protein
VNPDPRGSETFGRIRIRNEKVGYGSEKIIQDPQELEKNKNQIINTLKNYDISIQIRFSKPALA